MKFLLISLLVTLDLLCVCWGFAALIRHPVLPDPTVNAGRASDGPSASQSATRVAAFLCT